MKIHISGDLESNEIAEIGKSIQALSLDEEIELVETQEHPYMAITVHKALDGYLFRCVKLDFQIEVKQKEHLRDFILECCGIKKCTIDGLRVKEIVYGNRQTVAIEMFYKYTALDALPSSIKHTKEQFGNPTGLLNTKIYTDSYILKSILEENKLVFQDENKLFRISIDDSGSIVCGRSDCSPFPLDSIFYTSIYRDLNKHVKIKKKYPVFECFTNGKIENLVFSKRLLNGIRNDRSELFNLLDFVENAPKFQDERDTVVEELREFLCQSFKGEHVCKCDYLEVVKKAIPRSLNRYSLKMFIRENEGK